VKPRKPVASKASAMMSRRSIKVNELPVPALKALEKQDVFPELLFWGRVTGEGLIIDTGLEKVQFRTRSVLSQYRCKVKQLMTLWGMISIQGLQKCILKQGRFGGAFCRGIINP
jgi:hypothetical protein